MATSSLITPSATGPTRLALATAAGLLALGLHACVDAPKPWVPTDDAGPDAGMPDTGAPDATGPVDASTPDGATEVTPPDVDCGERLAPAAGRIAGGQQLCPGEAAAALTSEALATEGTPPYSYRWERRFWVEGEAAIDADWVLVEGASEPERLVLPDVPPEASFAYRRVVVDACGAEAVTDEVVVEATPLSGGVIGGPAGLCEQATARLEGVTPASGGRGPFSYAWQQKLGSAPWRDVAGARGESFETAPAQAGVDTSWRRLATNACGGAVASNELTIIGYPPLVAGRIAGPPSVCDDQGALTLTETQPASGGEGETTSRWERRGLFDTQWVPLEGATGPSATIAGPLTETTTFRRVDRNSCGEAVSNEVTVQLIGLPDAHTTSADQTLCAERAPSQLSVVYETSEVALGYQWQASSDGIEFADVPDATRAFFAPPAPVAPVWYRRRTDWTCGATRSRPIRVAPYPQLKAGAVGEPQELCADVVAERLTERAAPSGGNGVYQFGWEQRTGSTGPWLTIADASQAELEPGLLSGRHEFRRVVTDGCGVRTASEAVVIAVAAQLDAGTLRPAQTLCRGVAAAPLESQRQPSGGLGESTFSWEASVGSAPFQPIAGATGETYAPGQLSASTVFRRRLLNRCGQVATPAVSVLLRPSFQPGVIGASQTICAGRPPNRLESLQDASGGGGTFLYAWEQQRGDGPWTLIGDENGSELGPTQLDVTTRFRRRVIEDVCRNEATSNEVSVVVAAPFTPGAISGPPSFCVGTDVRLSSAKDAAGGLGAIAYTWQRWSGAAWETVPSATGATLTWRAGTRGETIRRGARSTCGQTYTDGVTLEPANPVESGRISGTQVVCDPSELRPLQSEAPGGGGVAGGRYRWEARAEGAEWQVVQGATEASLAPMVTGTTSFRRVFVNDCGEAPSEVVTVTVEADARPGEVTGASEACPGTSPGLLVGTPAEVEGGEPAVYAWQTLGPDGRWSALEGATGRSLDPGPLERTTVFRRVVASDCGEVASNEHVVVVPERRPGAIAAPPEPVCHGAATRISSREAAVGAGDVRYDWEMRAPGGAWEIVPDAEGPAVEVNDLTGPRELRRVATDRCGRLETVPVPVAVMPPLNPGTVVAPEAACFNRTPGPISSGQPASGGSGSFAYRWEYREAGEWKTREGASGVAYTFTTPQTGSLSWRRRAEDTVCGQSVTSPVVEVTVAAPLSAGRLGGGERLCRGDAAAAIIELEAASGGLGQLTWAWQRSADGLVWLPVQDASGPTLPAPVADASTFFRRLATNACGTEPSEPVRVEVLPALSSGVIGREQAVCAGRTPEALTELVAASGGEGRYAYVWEQAEGACSATTCAPILLAGGSSAAGARLAWSSDEGRSWTASQLPAGAAVTELEASPTAALAVLDGQLVRSTDGGRTFSSVTVPIDSDGGVRLTGLAWRAGRWFAGGPGQIATSDDDGLTWIRRHNGAQLDTEGRRIPFVSFARIRDDVIAGGASAGPWLMLRSVNRGNVWGAPEYATSERFPGAAPTCVRFALGATGARYVAGASSICDETVVDAADLWANPTFAGGVTWKRVTPAPFFPGFWGLGVGADGDAMFLGGAALGAVNRVAWLAAGSDVPIVRAVPGDAEGVGGPRQVLAVGDTWYVARSLALGQASILASRDDGQSWVPLVEPGFSVATLAGGLAAPAPSWVAIGGAVTASHTPSDATITRSYRRVLRDAVCDASVSSEPVVVSAAPRLEPGTLATTSQVCSDVLVRIEGTPAHGGSGPATYRWYRRPADTEAAWELIEGATLEDLTTPQSPGRLAYRREAVDGCGAVTTPAVTAQVATPTRAGEIGHRGSVCASATPEPLRDVLTGAGGFGATGYQWQVSEDERSWVDIHGATLAEYQPPAANVTRWFRRGYTSRCATVYTQPLKVETGGDLEPGQIGRSQVVCPSSAPELLTSVADASGVVGLSYQWQERSGTGAWTDILNATGATYQPGVVWATTEFQRLAVNSSCGSVASNIVTVTAQPVAAGEIEQARTVCHGVTPAAIASRAGASGALPPYSYSWLSSPANADLFAPVSGASGATFAFSEPVTSSLRFRRVASSSCGGPAATSNTMELTVLPRFLPGVIAAAGDANICDGASAPTLASLTPASGGDGAIRYRWERRAAGQADFEPIESATLATFAPGILAATTTFRRAAIGSCGTVRSNEVTITVAPQVTAGTILAAQTVCRGARPAALTTGVPPSGGVGGFAWRWERSDNGTFFTAIPEAESETHAPGPATQDLHYRRVNLNRCRDLSTPSVLVSTRAPLTPGAISRAQTICHDTVPEPLVGTVPTGGGGAYSYQWRSLDASLQWIDIPSATAAAYAPGRLTRSLTVRREVSDPTCSETAASEALTITVAPAPTGGTVGTLQGASSQTVCSGVEPGAFRTLTEARGALSQASITYTWQELASPSEWRDLPGATSEAFTPSRSWPTSDTTRTFRRVANLGACGLPATPPVTVTVRASLNPGVISGSQTICAGARPSPLSSLAQASGGLGPRTYLWERSTSGLNGPWQEIAGASDATYTPDALTTSTHFRRRAFDEGCGRSSSTTEPVLVTVRPSLSAGVISGLSEVCGGVSPGLFRSDAAASGGSGTYTYRWETSTDGQAWAPVATGGADATWTAPVFGATTHVRRVVTDGLCARDPATAPATASVVVRVGAALDAGAIAASQTLCAADSEEVVAFSSERPASGGLGEMRYRWYARTSGGDFAAIEGADSLGWSPSAIEETTEYVRRALNRCGEADTSPLTVTLFDPLDPGVFARDTVTVCAGGKAPALEPSAPSGGGGRYSFQWQSSEDGSSGSFQPLVGENASAYTPSDTSDSRWYRRVVTEALCSEVAPSPPVLVETGAASAGSIAPSSAEICAGAAAPTILSTLDVDGASYSWEVSTDGRQTWAVVLDAKGAQLNPSGSLSATTSWRRTATSSCGTATTDPVTVGVRPDVDRLGGQATPSQDLCVNEPPKLLEVLTNAGTVLPPTQLYVWQRLNGALWEDLPGTNAASYQPPGLSVTTRYRRVIRDPVCRFEVGSLPAELSVRPFSPGVIEANPASICAQPGSRVDLKSTTNPSGSGPFTHVWQRQNTSGGWDAIPGASLESYVALVDTVGTVRYRRRTASACGSGFTNEVSVLGIGGTSPGVVAPLSQDVCGTPPQVIRSTSPAAGSVAPSYLWQTSTDGVSWSSTGATTPDFQPPSAAGGSGPTATPQKVFYRRRARFGTCTSQDLFSSVATVNYSCSTIDVP
jgi:hypothetical protein